MDVRTRLRTATALLVAAGTAAAFAPPATAAAHDAEAAAPRPSRVVVVDRSGDVWRANLRTDEWREVGQEPEIDIRRAVVRHTRRVVRVRTHFVDLQPGHRTTFWVGFALPGREFAFSRVVARRGQLRGGHNLLHEPGGAKVDCPALRHEVDREADRVTIEVPRSCLGDPDWVRANVSAQLVRRGAPNHPFADNVHNAGAVSNFPTPRVWAPR